MRGVQVIVLPLVHLKVIPVELLLFQYTLEEAVEQLSPDQMGIQHLQQAQVETQVEMVRLLQ
tara:strand:- start:245 stop:430 length:186 start_codon:yes stop_codon:yes gene_type:complete